MIPPRVLITNACHSLDQRSRDGQHVSAARIIQILEQNPAGDARYRQRRRIKRPSTSENTMRSYMPVLALILCSAICACSKSEQSAARTATPPQQQDKTVFDPQLRALEKAKGVEGTVQQDAQHLKESIDQQEAPSH